MAGTPTVLCRCCDKSGTPLAVEGRFGGRRCAQGPVGSGLRVRDRMVPWGLAQSIAPSPKTAASYFRPATFARPLVRGLAHLRIRKLRKETENRRFENRQPGVTKF